MQSTSLQAANNCLWFEKAPKRGLFVVCETYYRAHMANLPLWTPIASILLAAAWLLPNASPPWIAFHKDVWTASILLLVSSVFLVKSVKTKYKFSLDPFSAVLLVLAALTATQWLVGIIYFSGHAALGIGYLLAAVLAILIGRAWTQVSPGALGGFLFLAFLVAALGTAAFMLIQWLGIDATGVWINEISSSGRPFGNLAQPNNAATLLLLGIVSIYWFEFKGKLGAGVSFIGKIYLLFFLALTGSRIGYLSFASLMLLTSALSFRHKELYRFRVSSGILFLLLPIFVYFVTYNWHGLAAISEAGPKLAERPLTSIRMLLYRAYSATALANPWWGSGFGQGVKTQLSAAELGFEFPGLFTWTHNAILDVATWFGIPVALGLIASVSLILINFVRTPFNTERSLYFAGICVVFMHAMVELPHAYAYFLLPTCMLLGAMLSGLSVTFIKVAAPIVSVIAVSLGALLLVIANDYLQVESAFYTWRFKQANVGLVHSMDVPDTRVLNQFRALLIGLRGSAESLDDEALKEFEQAVILFPSAAAMQHLAEIQLKQGNVSAAQLTADRARLLTSQPERRSLASRWAYLCSQDSRFRAVEWRE